MSHANAVLVPAGRLRLAQVIVDDGWLIRRAAERFQVSPTTAARWAARYRAGESMADRSSRPHHCPSRSSTHLERRVIALRFTRRWGEHRIAWRLRVPHATVGRILGRIPDGGGHRVFGRQTGRRNARRTSSPRGYAHLHHVIDDHSRLACSEILTDKRKQTVTAFWSRAVDWFTGQGIQISAVLIDNGPAYHSKLFNQALADAGIRHRYTRPYRPQTNGKVERFNRTLATEWAYAKTYRSET